MMNYLTSLRGIQKIIPRENEYLTRKIEGRYSPTRSGGEYGLQFFEGDIHFQGDNFSVFADEMLNNVIIY